MKTETFRLAVAQVTSIDDVATNLLVVEKLLRQAQAERADLVVFPENSLFLRIRSGTVVEGLDLTSPPLEELRRQIDELGVAMMLTTPMKSGAGKLRNATVFFEPGKSARVVYVKNHLFDVDVEGAPPVRESDHFVSGEGPQTLEFKGWNFGLSICYDLRFAELYLNYAQKVDVILIPSAFLVPTGEAHWHVLVRARAIESQCYVAAPAQAGEHVAKAGGPGRKTYGHSLVVDPWGRVLKELQTSPEIAVVEFNRELLSQARRQIPMGSHRRLPRG